MTTLTEKLHPGGFLISEADGHLSRDNGTLASGQNLAAGTVLGQLTSGGYWTAYDPNAHTGEETAKGILYGAVDASLAAQPCCVITRSAEVNGNELTYLVTSPAVDPDDAAADLAEQQIIVRN